MFSRLKKFKSLKLFQSRFLPPNVTAKLYLDQAWGTSFKVNELQRNWDFPFKPVAESQRTSKLLESGLLKDELEEKIDG